MSFFQSISRFFTSFFGLAQGKTERMTDKMVSANADTIRAQFRKTKEDWTRDYQEMRNAIAELIAVRDQKKFDVQKLQIENDEISQKMQGAVALYQQHPDEKYKEAYARLADRREDNENRVQALQKQITEQSQGIDVYKKRLIELQQQIDSLTKEEAETVADIVSSQKIKELNDRFQGVSTEGVSKNLQAVREVRQKLNTVAKISTEMSANQPHEMEEELVRAGAKKRHLESFDEALGKSQGIFHTPQEPRLNTKTGGVIDAHEVSQK